eukprot:TRINITY_DN3151_c0_g2_i2.p1 TRINITY_DN3151_c0_g2~~TRINITY_DN3151_c0_g2_i2.p1  ORF type:complete len:526 (+),score=109.16 TRINITY_DN3151_c0_g2_i2:1285-2862(+)
METIKTKAKDHFELLRENVQSIEKDFHEKIEKHFLATLDSLSSQDTALSLFKNQLVNGLHVGIEAVNDFVRDRSIFRLPVARDYLESNLKRDLPSYQTQIPEFPHSLPTLIPSEKIAAQRLAMDFDIECLRTDQMALQETLEELRGTVSALHVTLKAKEEEICTLKSMLESHPHPQFQGKMYGLNGHKPHMQLNANSTPQNQPPSIPPPPPPTSIPNQIQTSHSTTSSFHSATNTDLATNPANIFNPPSAIKQALSNKPHAHHIGSQIPAKYGKDAPTGLVVHPPTGDVYIGEFSNQRIQVLSSALDHKRVFGKLGSGLCEFRSINGLAFAPDAGLLGVVDRINNQVQFVTTSGKHVKTVGCGGSLKGEFSGPRAIAFDLEGCFYVADTGNHRIQKFSRTGDFLHYIGDPAAQVPVGAVDGICVSYDNEILAIVSGSSAVRVYACDGTHLRTIPIDRTGPDSVTIQRGLQGGFMVTDLHQDRITFYSSSGQLLKSLQVNSPYGAACDAKGRLFVANYATRTVSEY